MSGGAEERIDLLVLSSKRLKGKTAKVETGEETAVYAGMHVQVQGHDETFLVLRVDRERHLADLLRYGKVNKVETGVPLTLLRVVGKPGSVDEVDVPT
jgi:hypothetical protein